MGNNMGIAGGSYVAQVLRENTFIRELVSAVCCYGFQYTSYRMFYSCCRKLILPLQSWNDYSSKERGYSRTRMQG